MHPGASPTQHGTESKVVFQVGERRHCIIIKYMNEADSTG